MQAVVDATKKGDMVAAKILLDRFCPALKPVTAPLPALTPVTAPLPALTPVTAPLPALTPGRLSEQMNEIVALMIAGELSPDDTTTLFRTLLHVRQVADSLHSKNCNNLCC
ncbi:MAG: hypothetical protein ACRESZ_01025 [Methylococcales bacterium]